MDNAQIEQYLGCLGQKLEAMQIKVALILLGGALMITQLRNRKSTQDIDLTIRVRIEANMEISCPQFTHFSSNSKELAY
jgi:hypothetical protein